MKPTRIALAACILLGISGAAFAQSFGQIIQSGSNDQASIEQDTSATGSSAIARIAQARGSDNFAAVLQVPNSSGAAISATANVTQWQTFSNLADVRQVGVTGGSSVQLTQEYNNDTFGRVSQTDVNASQVLAYQSATNSDLLIRQIASTSAYAAAEQAGDASTVRIWQGQPGQGASNVQSRIYQNGQGAGASSDQYGVSDSTSYISQGSAQMPGYYYSASGWVEVDGTVLAESAPASTADVAQSGSNLTGYILQYGAEHYASLGQTGSGHLGGILQTGYFNHASFSQNGTGHVGTVRQSGSSNDVYFSQSGAFNTATVTQQGSFASAVLLQGGSGNTAAINQR